MTNKEESIKWNKIYQEVLDVSPYFRYSMALPKDNLTNVIHNTVAKLKVKEADGTVTLDDYENYKHYMFIIGNNYVLQQLNHINAKNQFLRHAEEYNPNIHSYGKTYSMDSEMREDAIITMIEELPLENQQVAYYRIIGLSMPEIAAEMNVELKDVKRWNLQLRRYLQK